MFLTRFCSNFLKSWGISNQELLRYYFCYVPNLRFSDKNVWQRIKLNEYADFLQGLTYTPNNVSTTGRLVLRSSNIQNSKLVFDDNVYVNMNIPAKISTKENFCFFTNFN